MIEVGHVFYQLVIAKYASTCPFFTGTPTSQHVLESDAFTILGNYVNEITLQVSRVYL